MTEDQEFQVVQRPGQRLVVRHDLVELADRAPATLWAAGEALAGAQGRAGARVVSLLDGQLQGVARDYRRGGALRAVFHESYFDPGRPARELALLAELRRRGVPVVEPLAALARRRASGLYSLRLITRLLPDALPLPAFAARFPEGRAAAVRRAGEVVAAAFDAGLRHPDLHPDNLIVAGRGPHAVDVRLLDLDRAALRPTLGTDERDRMLLRMARYLVKHAARLPIAVRRSEVLRFLAGMGLDRPARRAAVGRLAPRLVAELRQHGLDTGSR